MAIFNWITFVFFTFNFHFLPKILKKKPKIFGNCYSKINNKKRTNNRFYFNNRGWFEVKKSHIGYKIKCYVDYKNPLKKFKKLVSLARKKGK